MSEFVVYPDRTAWAHGVARACAMAIERGIERDGHATAALAGGSSPAAVLPALFAMPLPWERVTLTVSDERQVDEADPRSNFGQLTRLAAGTAAAGARLACLPNPSIRPRVDPPLPAAMPGEAGGVANLARDDGELSSLHLLWAGVGDDGHTLSWFPGPDLAAAYESAAPVIPVRPDPLPASAPVPRWTLTLAAARGARTILLAATGAAKRAILAAPGDRPVARLLVLPQTVVHWAP